MFQAYLFINKFKGLALPHNTYTTMPANKAMQYPGLKLRSCPPPKSKG